MTTRLRRSSRKALVPLVLTAVGVWLLIGCVYLPTFNKVVDGKDATRRVGPEKSRRPIRVGRATRTDVVRALGEPYRTSSDGRRVAYTWTVLNGLWVFPLCFQGYPQKEARTLILTFDSADTLAGYQLTKNPQNLLTLGGRARPNLPRDFFGPARPLILPPVTRPASQASE